MVREQRARRAEGCKCGNGLLFHGGDQQAGHGGQEDSQLCGLWFCAQRNPRERECSRELVVNHSPKKEVNYEIDMKQSGMSKSSYFGGMEIGRGKQGKLSLLYSSNLYYHVHMLLYNNNKKKAFHRTPPPFIEEPFSKHLNVCCVPGTRYGLSGILFLSSLFLRGQQVLTGYFGTGIDEWHCFVDI